MLVSSNNIGNKFWNKFLILYLFSIPQINGIRCNNITHCSVENGSYSVNEFISYVVDTSCGKQRTKYNLFANCCRMIARV